MDPPRTAQCIVFSAVVGTLILLFGYIIYIIYTFVYGHVVEEFRIQYFSLWLNKSKEDSHREISSNVAMAEETSSDENYSNFLFDCKDKKN